MDRELWKKAEDNLMKIMGSPFKKETAKEHMEFVASTNDMIEKMNSYCSSPAEQLKKQISL